MKVQTNLLTWKRKARSLLSLAWGQISMGSAVRDHPGSFCRFCGLLHVRSIAILIAIVEVLFIIYQAALIGADLLSPLLVSSTTSLIIHCSLLILATLVVLMHFVGIGGHKPALLIPHLGLQLILTVTFVALAAFSLYALWVGTYVRMRLTIEGVSTSEGLHSGPALPSLPLPRLQSTEISYLLITIIIAVAIFYVTVAIVNIWCFRVVLDCYRWMMLRLAEKASSLHESSQSTIPPPVTVIEPKKMENGAVASDV